ncbi:MAG: NAD(P)/FAD-dependent oxidoreductase [Elainellaceae cyanobacterium]
MMNTYDWIVVGNGLAGAALSYELANAGFSVVLLEKDTVLDNATRYSYGGIAYWSGKTDLVRQLCQESVRRYQQLSDELGNDIQFRELDLILTASIDADPQTTLSSYADCAIPPQWIDRHQACELEPLLNPEAIAGALTTRHGHVDPESVVSAYNQAFLRQNGTIEIATVTGMMRVNDSIKGVITSQGTYEGATVVVCAGGFSRRLLREAGIQVRQYFTHAELIETPPISAYLRTLVMPANLQRFALEAEARQPKTDALWDEPDHEIVSPILDAGAIQFQEGRIRIGQISRALTNPDEPIDAEQSEAKIRAGIAPILPSLASLPGQWHHCLVAFSGDGLPLIGAFPGLDGLHVFSGFNNPFAILPPLARRFVTHSADYPDPIIQQLSPNRLLV